MEKSFVKYLSKPKLKKPILIEGLPGVGNVGRVCTGYLISELKAKKFAELYSPHFLPLVIVKKGSLVHMLKAEFYYVKGTKRDIIIMTGDSQSISPNGHYEVCGEVIDLAKKMKVKDMVTIGGFASGDEITKPRVIPVAGNEKSKKSYEKMGVKFKDSHEIGTIVGASGLLLGLADAEGINSVALMGETVGFPLLITDPKAAEEVLKTITKITGKKIDLKKLEKSVKEMERIIKKTEEVHRDMLNQMSENKATDDVRYIG